MSLKKHIILFFYVFFCAISFAQRDLDSTSVKIKDIKIEGKLNISDNAYDPLAPSRAAFYAALLPGLGQIYNKKYWKAPIVWGALAIPTYYYQINNSAYKRYRNAYRLRKAGLPDEFTIVNDDRTTTELISTTTLETAQEQLKQNRDFSLLSGLILYVLQIVEASVNAHLLQFNTNDTLTLNPTFTADPVMVNAPTVGLKFKYTF